LKNDHGTRKTDEARINKKKVFVFVSARGNIKETEDQNRNLS